MGSKRVPVIQARPVKPAGTVHIPKDLGEVVRVVAVDRNTLFDCCWGIGYMPDSRTLDQHISQLRKRIERDPKNPTIIRTVHGVGYRYDG